MIKKWFEWTEKDIAAWERLRARGPWRFVLWYGAGLTGGGLFVLLGIASLLIWRNSSAGIPYLLLRLAFLAGLSLAGGLVNGVVTWVMEEAIYRRVYLKKKAEAQEDDPGLDRLDG